MGGITHITHTHKGYFTKFLLFDNFDRKLGNKRNLKNYFLKTWSKTRKSPVFCLTLYNVKLSRKIEGILNMRRKIVYEEKIFLLKKNESTEFFYKLRINFN